MPATESFFISDAEIRKTRRGAFLPALLILPIAAMFGLDSSKSQPMHFLMTLCVGIGFAAAVVSIGWYGAKRTISEYSRTSLTVADGKLIWKSGAGVTALDLSEIKSVDKHERRGNVQSITLDLIDGGQKRLQGYDRMNVLFDCLSRSA